MAVDKRRARDGNRSAWEVVDGPGGVRAVFEAVVSSDGLDALQMASRRMTNARMNEEEVNRALKARYRLDAFIERLEEMGREEVQPFDMGWRAEPGSAGEGLLPTRSPGTKGAGGERAAAVVVRLLGELPACDGLSALAVVVDGVNLPEPVDLNGRDDPLLPTSVALVGRARSLPTGASSRCSRVWTAAFGSVVFRNWSVTSTGLCCRCRSTTC